MLNNRNKLYFFLLMLGLVGYVWLFWNLQNPSHYHNSNTVCFIKNITNIPCPSCGTTRSILSILQGKFQLAFFMNPLGYLAVVLLFVLPIWVLIDSMLKKNSFFIFFKKGEAMLKKKPVVILLIAMLLINWIWNIIKEL